MRPAVGGIHQRIWGYAVNQQIRQQNYLSKAIDAEQRATVALSSDVREDWLKLALAYRDLASKLNVGVIGD
jgi:hypothetical protein